MSLKNKDKNKEYHRNYYLKNREKLNAYVVAYGRKHPEKIKKWCAKTKLNKSTEARAKDTKNRKRWKSCNRGKINYQQSLREATKLLATPAWVDMDLVKDMYMEATYQSMEVDHIIPLRGNNVCGLHWEGNLQLLTKHDNCVKGNRYTTEDIGG